MPNTVKIYIGVFLALMIGVVINDTHQKKPLDWETTFARGDKNPYGLYVLYQEFKDFFPDSFISNATGTPYEYLLDYYDEDTDKFYLDDNYIFIGENPQLDKTSSEYLFKMVRDGNTVFFSAYYFPKILSDSLKFEVENNFLPKVEVKDSTLIPNLKYKEPEISMGFNNQEFDAKNYSFKKGIQDFHFKKIDTLQTEVLGYQIFENKKTTNFIKIKYGKGCFILHTQPFIFTNYNLLKTENQDYASHILNFLPNKDLIIDDRNSVYIESIDSPLRYIFSKPALKWAWYLSLLSILIFMIFRAKRRQRIVPIIPKLTNTSIDFARTIGTLYHQEGKPQDIVYKKINYFLEYVRNTYLMDTQNLNEDFKKKLYAKSGVPLLDVERLVDFIVRLNNQREIGENSLVLLDKMIYNFHQKSLQNNLKSK